jgi:hypothetical protein
MSGDARLVVWPRRFVVRAARGVVAMEERESERRTIADRDEAVGIEIGDGGEHQVASITELAQRTVAVEAQESTDTPGGVIVVNVRSRSHLADRAQTVLLLEHRFKLWFA